MKTRVKKQAGKSSAKSANKNSKAKAVKPKQRPNQAAKPAKGAPARNAKPARTSQKLPPHVAIDQLQAVPFVANLADAVPYQLPVPPQPCDYSQAMMRKPLFGTLKDNNCLFSAIGNLILCWISNTGNPVMPVTSDDLQASYAYYAPAPGDFVGFYTGVNSWHVPGIPPPPNPPRDNITNFRSVNNEYQLCQSITLFGGVLIVLNIPGYLLKVQPPFWNAPPGGTKPEDIAPDRDLPHCVLAVGWTSDPNGPGFNTLTIVSWGKIYTMSKAFFTNYAPQNGDYMYAILSTDWLNNVGIAPSGLNTNQLGQAFQALFP